MKLVLGIVLGVVMCGTGWASSSTHEYEYQIRIPQTAATCQQEADELGARFHVATGIKPTTSICKDVVRFTADKKEYTLYSLLLTYDATEPALLYSANFGTSDGFGSPSDQQGFYTNYAACLADIGLQKQVFETQTGLTTVAVTCLPGKYNYSANYVLRLDGFGQPLKRLRLVDLKFLGTATPETIAQVDALVSSLGGTIVMRLDSQTLLYGADTFGVRHDNLGRLPSKDQCSSQAAVAQTLYSKLGSRSALLFCLPGYGTNFYLQAVREGSYFLSSDMGSSHDRYFSFQECTNDQARINFGQTNYVGAICHASDYADGQYELEMFSRL